MSASTTSSSTLTSKHTLLAASVALNSLLSRRRRAQFRTLEPTGSSPNHSGTSSTARLLSSLPTSKVSSITKRKKRQNSYLKRNRVLSEEEETRLKEAEEQHRIEENIRKLKKLGKRGTKERELLDEIQQLREERGLRRKGKGSKKREREVMDTDESD